MSFLNLILVNSDFIPKEPNEILNKGGNNSSAFKKERNRLRIDSS